MSSTEQSTRASKGKKAQRIEPDLLDSQVDDEQLEEERNFVNVMNQDDISEVENKDGGFYLTTLKMALEVYNDVPDEGKIWAQETYPWLVSRLRAAPEFDVSLKVEDNPRNPLSPFIRRVDNTRLSTLHPIFTDIHQVNGQEVSGMQILLAISGNMNAQLQEEIDIARIDDRPVPMGSLETVSLGDARNSHAAGVYALRWRKINAMIVGYTISQGFMYRLGLSIYSIAKRVVESVGAEDQTVDRDNFILFNLSRYESKYSNLRWLGTGLESLGILVFCSTDPAYGLNSRIADPAVIKVGYTFNQLVMVWEGVKKVTAAGRPIPPWGGRKDTPGGMEMWVQIELLGTYFPRDAGVYPICRIIRHLDVVSRTGLYPSFPPLPASAWLTQRPLASVGPVEYSSNLKINFQKGVQAFTYGVKLNEHLAAAARQVDVQAFAAARLSVLPPQSIITDQKRRGQNRAKINRERRLGRISRLNRVGELEVDELDSTNESEED